MNGNKSEKFNPDYLQELATETGLSVRAMAEHVGVSPSVLSVTIRGRSVPFRRNADRIGEVLGISGAEVIAWCKIAVGDGRETAYGVKTSRRGGAGK